jgi:arsenate reductase
MLNEYRVHLHVYGIANCDSCRAARQWLKTRKVPHDFHDIRKEGLDEARIRSWLDSAHGDYLVNRRSATWRRLSEAQRQRVENDPAPVLLEHPTLMKRPVITDDQGILDVGFDPINLEDYI